jgi:hypothetical protein
LADAGGSSSAIAVPLDRLGLLRQTRRAQAARQRTKNLQAKKQTSRFPHKKNPKKSDAHACFFVASQVWERDCVQDGSCGRHGPWSRAGQRTA